MRLTLKKARMFPDVKATSKANSEVADTIPRSCTIGEINADSSKLISPPLNAAPRNKTTQAALAANPLGVDNSGRGALWSLIEGVWKVSLLKTLTQTHHAAVIQPAA
jgi:ABC-type microcin C transport system permease subunit YejE